jgi:hypothetical protein
MLLVLRVLIYIRDRHVRLKVTVHNTAKLPETVFNKHNKRAESCAMGIYDVCCRIATSSPVSTVLDMIRCPCGILQYQRFAHACKPESGGRRVCMYGRAPVVY